MSEISNILNGQIIQTGVGMTVSGLVGFVAGYAIKKVLKIVLVAVGVAAAAMGAIIAWLQNQGIITITVDYTKLNSLIQSTMTWATAQISNFATLAMQGLAIAGSAGIGFLIGFQKG